MDNTPQSVGFHATCWGNAWHSPTKLCYSYGGDSTQSYKSYVGNYYSDYSGNDGNNDGIGDTPYTHYKGDDRCPLMQTADNYDLQVWYLANPIMYRGDMSKQGATISIGAGSSEIWVADQPALMDISFGAGNPDDSTSWTGQITLFQYMFTPFPGTGDSFTLRIGYADDQNGSNFWENGPEATVTGDGSTTSFPYTTNAIPFTVPQGKYLALRIGNNSDSRSWDVHVGGSWSYVTAPPSGPDIYVATLAFGGAVVNQTSTKNLVIQNVGNVPLRVDSVKITDSAVGAFVRGAFSPTVIQGPGSTTVPITFTPAEPNTYVGKMMVYSDSPNEGATEITLTGTGLEVMGTEVTADPNRIASHPDSTSTITVVPMTAGKQKIDPALIPQVTLTTTAGTFAGDGAQVEATLQPDSTYTAVLHAEADVADTAAITATLFGSSFETRVTFVPAKATVSPASIDFGFVRVDGSKTAAVLIQNDGWANLVMDIVSTDVPFSHDVPSEGMVVSYAQTDTILVTFAPSDTGSFADTLSFMTNDPTQPSVSVPLFGRSVLDVVEVVPRTPTAFFLYTSDADEDKSLPVAPGVAIVDVNIRTTDLSGFSFTLSYDPSLLEAQSCTVGPFLGSTGLSVGTLKDSVDNTTGKVMLECTTPGGEDGPDGSGTLGTIVFRTQDTGTGTVSIDSIHIFTRAGEVAPSDTLDGSVSIEHCYFADLDNDGNIDVLDIQKVAGRYHTYPSLDDPMSYRADIDGSGKVRINDVQSVAGRFGMEVPPPTGSDKPVVASASRSTQCGKGSLVLRWDGKDRQMHAGDRFRVDLITGACEELGAFQFDLVFDPAQVEIEEVIPGDLWGGSRNKICSAGPCVDLVRGRMKYGIYSLGTRPGMYGSGVLVTVEMTSKVEGTIHLDVENVEVGDMLGVPVPVTVVQESDPAVVEEGAGVPNRFALSQNHPNPFNTKTTIRYDVAKAGVVHLSIYAMTGHRVRTLEDGERPAGSYSVMWDGTDDAVGDVASGVYLCRMEAGEYSAVRKLVLVH